MGKGGLAGDKIRRTVSTEEVQRHNSKDDKWLLINGKAYDITNFAKRHPGGAKLISHYAGEDASDAWNAFHNDKDFVSKFLKPLYIGDVVDYKPSSVQDDFRELRQTVEKNGWMKADPMFFTMHLAHVILLFLAPVFVLWYFGTGWVPYLAAMALFVTSQAQAGWTQHDYGHSSVFKEHSVNHWFHYLTIGLIKGASSHWWNFRHFQHHAKPNRRHKDPDVDFFGLFLTGEQQPKEWGLKKKGFFNYEHQHNYFFFLGPPLLLPLYFHYEVIYFCVKRRDYLDLFLTTCNFIWLQFAFAPFLGGWGTFFFYMISRMIESHWFVWVTQMSHIPKDIKRDEKNMDWFSLQLNSTVNVDSSPFLDWFTGHLNFQIEHHLFPTMPRHNYAKVAPLVRSLCKKHGLDYVCQPILSAWGDLVRSLKKSGQIWYDAYHE